MPKRGRAEPKEEVAAAPRTAVEIPPLRDCDRLVRRKPCIYLSTSQAIPLINKREADEEAESAKKRQKARKSSKSSDGDVEECEMKSRSTSTQPADTINLATRAQDGTEVWPCSRVEACPVLALCWPA